jgi:long-chain acyl-CoA synthetase
MSTTLVDLLDSAALQSGDNIALYCGERTISYSSLKTSSESLARWLILQGLKPGDRVALQWPNAIETVELYFAIFKAGLIAVPVNLRLKPLELAYVIGNSGAALSFIHPVFAALAKEAGVTNMLTEIPAAEASDIPLPEIRAEDPVMILYTSGSTGRPKGAVHTHASLLKAAHLSTRDYLENYSPRGTSDNAPPVRCLIMTPMMHASGLYSLFSVMHLRESSVLLPVFEPGSVLDAIERFRCTVTLGLPAMMQFLAAEQERQPRDVSSLNLVYAGGDSVPLALHKRIADVFGAVTIEGLAQTETGPTIANLIGQQRAGSLGKPARGIEIRLVDANRNDVTQGEPGELIVRSSACCVGYWDNPDATREAIHDGWFHTGDLISEDAEGYYWFRGRKKEIIIRGGSNISPQEVEEELYRHPAILEAGVVGLPDEVWGERVMAFVSLRAGAAAEEHEIRAFALQNLADYKVPERILFLPALPKGPTGKVHRKELKEKLLADLAQ